MFSLICAWINVWLNNRVASDLRRHRAHYDVHVMHSCHIFPWLCAWSGCTIIFCQELHRDTRKRKLFCFDYYCESMICANNWVHYSLRVVFVCLHINLSYYHRYGDLDKCIEHIKSLSVIFRRRLNPLSQLSYYMQYMGLCVISLPVFFLLMIVRIIIFYLMIIVFKSEIWIIRHCLGLKQFRPWNNGMRCTSCYFLGDGVLVRFHIALMVHNCTVARIPYWFSLTMHHF